MNYRIGLMRLWLVLAAIWNAFIWVALWPTLMLPPVGPPALVLAIGTALYWAAAGFRGGRSRPFPDI